MRVLGLIVGVALEAAGIIGLLVAAYLILTMEGPSLDPWCDWFDAARWGVPGLVAMWAGERIENGARTL